MLWILSEKSKNFDEKSNPNQSEPNQSEPNQSKPNQSKPNQSKLNQSKPNQSKWNFLKSLRAPWSYFCFHFSRASSIYCFVSTFYCFKSCFHDQGGCPDVKAAETKQGMIIFYLLAMPVLTWPAAWATVVAPSDLRLFQCFVVSSSHASPRRRTKLLCWVWALLSSCASATTNQRENLKADNFRTERDLLTLSTTGIFKFWGWTSRSKIVCRSRFQMSVPVGSAGYIPCVFVLGQFGGRYCFRFSSSTCLNWPTPWNPTPWWALKVKQWEENIFDWDWSSHTTQKVESLLLRNSGLCGRMSRTRALSGAGFVHWTFGKWTKTAPRPASCSNFRENHVWHTEVVPAFSASRSPASSLPSHFSPWIGVGSVCWKAAVGPYFAVSTKMFGGGPLVFQHQNGCVYRTFSTTMHFSHFLSCPDFNRFLLGPCGIKFGSGRISRSTGIFVGSYENASVERHSTLPV